MVGQTLAGSGAVQTGSGTLAAAHAHARLPSPMWPGMQQQGILDVPSFVLCMLSESLLRLLGLLCCAHSVPLSGVAAGLAALYGALRLPETRPHHHERSQHLHATISGEPGKLPAKIPFGLVDGCL